LQIEKFKTFADTKTCISCRFFEQGQELSPAQQDDPKPYTLPTLYQEWFHTAGYALIGSHSYR